MSLRERKLERRYRNILEVEHKNTFSSLENIDSRGNLILYRFNLKSTELATVLKYILKVQHALKIFHKNRCEANNKIIP
jgi:hypothetical protein